MLIYLKSKTIDFWGLISVGTVQTSKCEKSNEGNNGKAIFKNNPVPKNMGTNCCEISNFIQNTY